MISMQFVYIMRFCKEVNAQRTAREARFSPGMELLNLWLVGSTLGHLVMNLPKKPTFNTWTSRKNWWICTATCCAPRLSYLFLCNILFRLLVVLSIWGLDTQSMESTGMWIFTTTFARIVCRHSKNPRCFPLPAWVSSVLRTGSGLVWFPMHIWRLFTLSIMEPRAAREVGIVQAGVSREGMAVQWRCTTVWWHCFRIHMCRLFSLNGTWCLLARIVPVWFRCFNIKDGPNQLTLFGSVLPLSLITPQHWCLPQEQTCLSKYAKLVQGAITWGCSNKIPTSEVILKDFDWKFTVFTSGKDTCRPDITSEAAVISNLLRVWASDWTVWSSIQWMIQPCYTWQWMELESKLMQLMIAVLRRFSYQGNAGHTFAADNRGEIQKMAICYCHTQVQAMAIRNSLPTDLNLTNAPNSRIYYAPWLEDLKQLWNSTWFRTLGSLDVLRCSFHKSRPPRIAWWKCNDMSSHHTPPDGFCSMRGFGTPPSFKVFLVGKMMQHVLKCSHLTFDVWNPFDHILRSLGKSCLGTSLQTACRLQWSRLRLKKYLYRADFGRLWPMATWPFLPRCLACWSRVEWFVSSQNPTTWLLLVGIDMNGHDDIWGGQEALSNGSSQVVNISMDSLEMSSE